MVLGVYGYLSAIISNALENSAVMSSEYSNEAIPTKAKFERNIISHALSLGINKIFAVPASMDILINFTGNVSIPVIRNAKTGEFYRLNRDFVAGDKVTINTRNGEKSVILTRFGVDFNIINAVDAAASWWQLRCGNNTFYYAASSGGNNMQITFTHTDLFAGV